MSEAPARRSFRATRILFAVALLLATLSAAPSAWARGSRDDPLAKVDQLIADRRYNEAILALTDFIKKEPTRFDDAQKRLQRIVHLREEYNALAGELLDVLVNAPTDDERKLALIRQLESLEKEPNRATREFISKTKETALFTYNRAQFEAIMAEGRRLIDTGQYAAAAAAYRGGFTLYKEEFDQAGYGELVVSRVEDSLRYVRNAVDDMSGLRTRMDAAVAAFEAAAGRVSSGDDPLAVEPATLAPLLSAAEQAALSYAEVRNAVESSGRGFESQFLLLQSANAALTDSSFLPFAFRFMLGRKTELRPEGIVGAMDTYWMDAVNRAQGAATKAADAAWDAARTRGGAEDYRAVVSFAELASSSVSIWSAIAGPELTPSLTTLGKTIAAGKPEVFNRYRFMAKAAGALAVFAERKNAFDERAALAEAAFQPTVDGEGAALATLADARSYYRSLDGEIAGALDANDRIVGEYRRLSGAALAGTEAGDYLQSVDASYRDLQGTARSRDADAASSAFRISLGQSQRSYDALAAEFLRGRTLLDGAAPAAEKGAAAPEAESSGEAAVADGAVADAEALEPPKYPSQSVPVFGSVDTGSATGAATLGALLDRMRSDLPYVVDDQRVKDLDAAALALTEAFGRLRAQALAALTDARDKVQQATLARQEGDRRYAEARSALAQQNFDRARERVLRAGERYDLSLSIQEDAALRSERDTKLLALSAEISRVEQEVVVRDVRRLITEGKQYYFQGSFEQAETALLRAQSRWKTTNVDDEPEVAYWLTLVRSALSIKTGRTIPVTAPLYGEMSQLLSFARQSFEKGAALLAARRKTEALAAFAEAKAKIQDVKVVFPLNQEASLLELRIDQLVDPDAFTESFRRKIADAQGKLKTLPQEAYSELQDLYTINPRYPGLKAIIEQAEIDLGLRRPPPDRAALARSAQLTEAARRIVESNLRGQFPVALEQLNEALKLNPDNATASSLKDRIQTDVGGQVAVALTSQDEALYQKAVLELQKGNTIVAQAIVQQLLQNPRNRNVPRLLELEKRIEARL